MTQYLLSVYQPDGDPPPPEILEPIVRDVETVDREMRQAGVWVFAGGLHAPTAATVVRDADGEVIMTDGPYVEGKEHLGGFTIVEAADLDGVMQGPGSPDEDTRGRFGVDGPRPSPTRS